MLKRSMFKRTVPQLRHGTLALMLALSTVAGAAAAQDFTVGWHPRSGDVWVDTWLGDVNRYGARYPDPFVDEMVRYHDAPRPLVVELLQTRHWAPGDVYFACTLASIIGRPCRYVVDLYEADRGQGWGVVAQRLGIKPGSAEFHRLKKGFVPTYDRWGRPISLDDDLRRDFPNRGKGKATAVQGKAHADHGAANAGPGKGKSAQGRSAKADHGPASRGSSSSPGKGKSSAHDAHGGGKPTGKGQGGQKKKGNGKG